MTDPGKTTSIPIDQIDLFRGLNPTDQSQALSNAQTSHLEDGAYLFFEGDPADRVFTLASGRIRLSQTTPEGQQIILHHVFPGEAFGIIAVITDAPYPVTAQSIGESEVYYWDSSTMEDLMSVYPAIAINVIHFLARRVRDYQDRIRELSTERVERRIARALLRLASQAGRKMDEGVLIDLPLTRQDLAEMSGTTVFTVSRTLSQWESQGIVQSGRERIVIRYPHGLVSIAEDLGDK